MTSPKGPTGRRLWKSEWKQSWIQISPACIMNPLSIKIHVTSFRLQLRRWSGWSSTLSCFNSKIVAPSAWRPTDLSLSTTTFLGSQEKSWHHRHPVRHWYMICSECLLSIYSMYSFTVSPFPNHFSRWVVNFSELHRITAGGRVKAHDGSILPVVFLVLITM